MLTAAAAASAGWTEAVAKPEETPGPASFGSGIPEQAERAATLGVRQSQPHRIESAADNDQATSRLHHTE